jgi:hypothetical protein
MTKAIRYGAYAAALLLAAVVLSHLHTHTHWLNETCVVASIIASFAAVWLSIQSVRAVRSGRPRSDG